MKVPGSPQTPAEVARAVFEALNQGHLEPALEFSSDDVHADFIAVGGSTAARPCAASSRNSCPL